MKNTTRYILIIIAIILLSVGGTLVGEKIYDKVVENNYNKLVKTTGVKKVTKVNYEIPGFALIVSGIYDTTITNIDIKDMQVYKISAVLDDSISKNLYTYNGVKFVDALELSGITDYNSVTFKAGGKLQVKFDKDEISENVYLVFDVNDNKYPSNEPVSLLAPDYNARFSITDVVALEFD